ncbi:MAG: hypothetical protein U0Q16_09005 [Bryobacteraceae bacterium]
MTEPANRARTRLGVGERVSLTFSLGSATWSGVPASDLSSTSGATVVYTAPETAQSVTITATGGGCTASISFQIVQPNAVVMTPRYPGKVQHTQNYPDVGMYTKIFLMPDDVNFHRVEFLEDDVPMVGNGVYSCHNGSGHHPNPNGLGATTHVSAGQGTEMNANDHVYSGHCGSTWSSPDTGSEHFPIPWKYRVVGKAAWRAIQTVDHRISCASNGLLTATKAGAWATIGAGDATGDGKT